MALVLPNADRKCLIVDPDAPWQNQLADALEAVPGVQYNISFAGDLHSAFDKIRGGTFDLMLLDLSLDPHPDISRARKFGRELLIKLKTSGVPIPPTIIVSGTGRFDDIRDLLNNFRDCVRHFVQKDEFQDFGPRQAFLKAVTEALSAPDEMTYGFISSVLRAIDAFPEIVTHLRTRLRAKPPIMIDDEYDLQDVLYAILKPAIMDLSREEWTPKDAGRASRVDLVSATAGVFIEVKYVHRRSDVASIVNDVKVDIESYYQHRACRTMVAFIYDPQLLVPDARQIENQLSGRRRIKDTDMDVIAIIRPR